MEDVKAFVWMSLHEYKCGCMDKCAHQLTGQLTAAIEVKIREVDEVRQHTHITYAIPTPEELPTG